MNIPEYITKEEVRRVCSAIGIRDWTALTEAKVKIEEAVTIQKLIGGEALAISAEDFRDGLDCFSSSERNTRLLRPAASG